MEAVATNTRGGEVGVSNLYIVLGGKVILSKQIVYLFVLFRKADLDRDNRNTNIHI